MILLLPPLGSGPSFWDPLRRELSDLPTMAPTLDGATPADEQARGLAAVTDAVAMGLDDVPGVLVVGLSLGGLVAIDLCARYPKRVLGLVIADAVPTYPSEMVELWRERAATARAEGVASFVDPTMSLWFTPELLRLGSPQVEEARRVFLAQDPQRYARHCLMLAEVDCRATIASLNLPARVVCGEDDALPFVEAAEWFAAELLSPPATLVPGARHASALERPEVVADVVRELWAAVSPNA